MVKKGKTAENVMSVSREGGERGGYGVGAGAMSHYDRMGGGAGAGAGTGAGGGAGGLGGTKEPDDRSVTSASSSANRTGSGSGGTQAHSNPIELAQQRAVAREKLIVERHLFGVAPPDDPADNAAVMEDPQVTLDTSSCPHYPDTTPNPLPCQP